MMTERRIAEIFPPGEFIKEELEARDWSQVELAEILGRDTRLVNQIISGTRSITPETAQALGDAFGTGAQFWLNLESAYQLSRAKAKDDAVIRRARLYERFPVREMLRRHWIEPSRNMDVLEKRFCNFFGIAAIDGIPQFAHAARKSNSYKVITPTQKAWLFRVRQLARCAPAKKFSGRDFDRFLNGLRSLMSTAEEARHIPRVLAENGIRFVVVEPLANTRIDGVCFWLDRTSPVIGISLRFDRIDSLWYTLLHECAHVKNRDASLNDFVLDTDLIGDHAQAFEKKPEMERQADILARELSVRRADLDDFIIRTRPLYSRSKIINFASRIGVHPGIVVGQLQYRGEIPYSHSRAMLVPIRNSIIPSALTDGWGHTPIVGS